MVGELGSRLVLRAAATIRGEVHKFLRLPEALGVDGWLTPLSPLKSEPVLDVEEARRPS